MKQSSSGSSRYRVHNGSDIMQSHPSSGRSRGSSARHKEDLRDQLPSWAPGSPPAVEYSSYSPHAYSHGHHEYHQAYPMAHSPIAHSPIHHMSPAHGGYPLQQHPVYPSSPHHEYPPAVGGYESQPIPSPRPPPIQHHRQPMHTPTHSHSQPLTQYSHLQNPEVIDRPPSHGSELSQYSLSHYKPTKPRFRIEQEGHNLVVLPPGVPGEAPASPPAPPPNNSVSVRAKRWPPNLYQTDLSLEEAEDYISDGAPKFRGELREVANGPRGQYHFYAFAGDEYDEETDTAPFQSDSFGDMSSSPEGKPTDALERPAMGHAFGTYPGTVTLAYFVSSFGSDLKGSEVAARCKVRKLTMLYVLDRLRSLQVNGIEEDPIKLHAHLYQFLLHDNHKYEYPPRPSLDSQIADLVAALCRPSWVDFSLPENQTVAQFLASGDPSVANSFFHQLLLSVELYLRVNARPQAGLNKALPDMPEKIRWDMMLAQRWLENVEIEPPRKVNDGRGRHGEQKSSVGFKFPNKRNQTEALRNFAWTLKWPNMNEVEYTLTEEDNPNELLEDRSHDCMSWFTGLLLPGKSMPFILMSSLINCDIDTPQSFQDINQTRPNIGFQYRGHTYWSWECIVGKVLGAASGVQQIAGWVGPCSASADLQRSEMAIINQASAKGNRISAGAVRNMGHNSDPLGPANDQESFPVTDYVPLPPNQTPPVDTIRIERLNFSPAASNPKGIHRRGLEPEEDGTISESPLVIFDASITFAITVEQRARSWKVSLRHDTPFIAAYPCNNRPHVLYSDYYHRPVKVDELVDIQNWGASGGGGSDLDDSEEERASSNDVDEVLVIEAFGVPDNEVFARAWCSFWGLPSITADITRTCTACAIREAYAALVSVVIMTNRGTLDVEVEEVDRMLEAL